MYMYEQPKVDLPEPGWLAAEYRLLEKVLGPPRRWSSGDRKVRAVWKNYVANCGHVMIFDYKEDLPVEQVKKWSIIAKPAVQQEILKLLQAQVGKLGPLEKPKPREMFEVERWYYLPHEDLPVNLEGLVSSLDWESILDSLKLRGVEKGKAWVGLVKYWFVLRIDTEEWSEVTFYDPDSMDVLATYTITMQEQG